VPGLILSLAFVAYIVVRAKLTPVAGAADADRAPRGLGGLGACSSSTSCR
jgi:hypothetical protein